MLDAGCLRLQLSGARCKIWARGGSAEGVDDQSRVARQLLVVKLTKEACLIGCCWRKALALAPLIISPLERVLEK